MTKGISYHKHRNRWMAYINIRGEGQKHLGSYSTEIEAAAALEAAKIKYEGLIVKTKSTQWAGKPGIHYLGWKALKRINGKAYYVGVYDTLEEAKCAQDEFTAPEEIPEELK